MIAEARQETSDPQSSENLTPQSSDRPGKMLFQNELKWDIGFRTHSLRIDGTGFEQIIKLSVARFDI